jgi:hypothetical protein
MATAATTSAPASPAASTAKVGTVRRPPAMLMRWLARAEPVLYRNLLAQQQHRDTAGVDKR